MIKADFIRTYTGKVLPFFQELRANHREELEEVTITYEEVVRGTHVEKILSISHRWMLPTDPDPDGEQLKSIKVFLDSSKGKQFKFVWIDSGSMPQDQPTGTRTKEDTTDMKIMLSQVNMLYLGTTVLILLDLSYLSRFWTQFEAWLSMQFATPSGLKSAVGTHNARYHIVCIQNAADQKKQYTKALTDQWANKTPQQAFDILSKPDVTVTNLSDKEGQLPKIMELDATVQAAFNAVDAQLQQRIEVSTEAVERAIAALQEVKARAEDECRAAKERAEDECRAIKERAEADCRAIKERAESEMVPLAEAVKRTKREAASARAAKEDDFDDAYLQQVIDNALAESPEGYEREVEASLRTVKGGVKRTTLVIRDTNRKSKLLSTTIQEFEGQPLQC